MKKTVKSFKGLVGLSVLLLGMGLNLEYALNDYGLPFMNVVNKVDAQTTGVVDPGSEVWTSMYVNCYNQYGNTTGKRLICYQPGYKNSCTPHDCR